MRQCNHFLGVSGTIKRQSLLPNNYPKIRKNKMFYFTLFIFTILPIFSYSCPSGTVEGHNGICYKAHTDPLNWFDADAQCMIEGGHLAAIPDAFTNVFLANYSKSIFGSGDYWIGGLQSVSPVDNSTFWEWLDLNNSFAFVNWANGNFFYKKFSV